MTETLDQTDEEKIRALLEGHRIVAAEIGSFDHYASGRLTLDDGTQVLVLPNEGCGGCPAGEYELTHLAKVDNIITDVRLACESEEPDAYEPDQVYRIYVVADATEINVLSVAGSDGNGYYGSGYELKVVRP